MKIFLRVAKKCVAFRGYDCVPSHYLEYFQQHHCQCAKCLKVFPSLQQSRDPQLQLSLDSYSDVFSVSTAGIRRYLTLVQPLDREAQDSYTFMVFEIG